MAFLAGWRLYVVGIVVLAVLAAGGYIAYLRQQHDADVARLDLAHKQYSEVSEALKESEADKALLARKATELDSAIQERDSRLKALNETKRKLADELDRIKKTVPAEDQTCLSRDLPSGILDLLRDGAADSNAARHYPGSGEPAPPLP